MCRRGTTEGTLKELLSKPTLFLLLLNFGQNSLTTQYTQKVSKSRLLTMDFSTPMRTKTNNTCHNTSVPDKPYPPILPPFFGAASHVVRAYNWGFA